MRIMKKGFSKKYLFVSLEQPLSKASSCMKTIFPESPIMDKY